MLIKLLVPALPLGLLVAVVDELLQLSSVGRSAQVSDVLIDLIGILLGTLFIWLIFIVCRAARNKKLEKA